jgi:hypothetical protein
VRSPGASEPDSGTRCARDGQARGGADDGPGANHGPSGNDRAFANDGSRGQANHSACTDGDSRRSAGRGLERAPASAPQQDVDFRGRRG